MAKFKDKYLELLVLAESKASKIVIANSYIRKDEESYFSCWRRHIENEVYHIYLNTPCETKEDVLRIAGLAYSWMPTMLDLYYDENYNWQELLSDIDEFKQGNFDIRASNNFDIRLLLVTKLSKLINHSIVGASKTLHLIKPDIAPIVDSRVIKGWNIVFEQDNEIAKLPNNWSWGNERELDSKVKKYIKYWDYLLLWQKELESNVTLRDIEILFFLLGG